MDSDHIHPSRNRLPLMFSAGAVMLVLIQLLVLVPEWHLWHSGAAEVYVGQHRKLVFGSLSGILLALALPLQAFLTHSKKLLVGHRRLLSVLSTALVFSSVALLSLR